MHSVTIAAIYRMARRPSIIILLKGDVIKRLILSKIIVYATDMIPERLYVRLSTALLGQCRRIRVRIGG